MTHQQPCAYQCYQIEFCKENADLDMALDILRTIPTRDRLKIDDAIKDVIINILAEFGWLDLLYDEAVEVKRIEALEDDEEYVQACELEMNERREAGVMAI